MKILKTSLATLALTVLASSASAVMEFNQYISGSPIAWLDEDYSGAAPFGGNGQYYSGIFNNITGPGGLLQDVDFSTYEIVSAVVKFGFADNSDYDWDFALLELFDPSKEVKLEGDQHDGNAVEVDGSHDYGFDYHEAEIEEADFGKLEDGEVEFKISAPDIQNEDNNFWLKKAKIKVTVEKKSTPVSVPDSGTTALLLGVALPILAALRRRLR